MEYAKEVDYLKLYDSLPNEFTSLVKKASRTIDILTYNRIFARGFNSLTALQQKTVTECCCEIIQFYDENSDTLDSVLNSYSINGVSMQFNFNSAVYQRNGVVIRASTYSRLMSTGLCYGGI